MEIEEWIRSLENEAVAALLGIFLTKAFVLFLVYLRNMLEIEIIVRVFFVVVICQYTLSFAIFH